MEAVLERESTRQPIPFPVPAHDILVMSWDSKKKITFNHHDPDQVAMARAGFDGFRVMGYLAYKLNTGGAQGEVIDTFDPETEHTVLTAPMIGG